MRTSPHDLLILNPRELEKHNIPAAVREIADLFAGSPRVVAWAVDHSQISEKSTLAVVKKLAGLRILLRPAPPRDARFLPEEEAFFAHDFESEPDSEPAFAPSLSERIQLLWADLVANTWHPESF
jgi:hypothetical protein